MTWVYYSDLDAFTIYHQAQEKAAEEQSESFFPSLGNAAGGAAGTAVSNLIVYPLDLVITRLQVQRQLQQNNSSGTAASEKEDDSQYHGLIDAMRKIYRNEGGLSAFYSGVLQSTGKSVADAFLFFLAYNFLMRARKRRPLSTSSSTIKILDEIALGSLAGAFARGLTTPISTVVTRKQTAAMSSASASKDSKPQEFGRDISSRDIVKTIYETHGILGFWTGYSATVFLTLNPSLTFFLDSFLRKLLHTGENPGSGMTFLVAATGKAVASTLMYPLSLAKARAQTASMNSSPSDKKSPSNVLATIPAIVRHEGVNSLYAGVSGEILKGFFSHGLTMLVKQRIQTFVVTLFYIIIRNMKKIKSS